MTNGDPGSPTPPDSPQWWDPTQPGRPEPGWNPTRPPDAPQTWESPEPDQPWASAPPASSFATTPQTWSTPQAPGAWRPPDTFGTRPAAAEQAEWQNHPGWGQPQQPSPRRRTGLWLTVALIAAVLLVVALLNATRNRGNDSAAVGPQLPLPATSAPNQPSQPNPGPSGGSGGSGATPVPAVSCPVIRDEESHISYRCVDNYLVQGLSDNYLGLRISLNHEVEPNWVISEGSGNPKSLATPPPNNTIDFRQGPPAAPSAGPATTPSPAAVPTLAAVEQEVRRRTSLALEQAYGSSPTFTSLGERTRTFSGVTGFQLATNITINPAYRAARGLKATSERLWVVGIPTKAGVSIFMLSIPNARSDLWPKADATIGSITVI
jgi:hypothetical protein